MRRDIRFALLSLALVLCTLAGMSSPAKAVAQPPLFCGSQNPPECNVDQDCNAYCQPCGYTAGICNLWMRGIPPGFCSCR